MKCPGCGANLGLEDQFCPYCGTANPHALQHQAEMQNFRHEFEKTRDRVEERANRFAGFAVPLTILGIAVALLIASLIFSMNAYQIGKSIRTRHLAAQGAELRARIENALDERDYGFIEALYTNQDLYLLTSSYGNNQVLKDYDMIFRACEYYEWAEATIADLPGRSGYRFSAERIRETCEYLADNLHSLYTLENKNWYDESCRTADKLEQLHMIQGQMSALLMTYAGFSEEETARIPDQSEEKLQEILIGKLSQGEAAQTEEGAE